MSIVTVTNQAKNPGVYASITGYTVVAGTGGTATTVRNAGAGYVGAGFARTAWTVATTAVSGGCNYLTTSLSASTQYTHQFWVRASKVQRVALTVQYQNAAHAAVGAATTGAAVVLVANTWTQVTVTATSGALVTEASLTGAAVAGTGGVVWVASDTFDVGAVQTQTGAVATQYFDGTFTNAFSIVYAWTGTANASTSTAITYTPAIALAAFNTPTSDYVVVTVTDLSPFDNVVNVWRTADGTRKGVRSAKHWTVNTSNAVTDNEPPLGRIVSYDLEVITGVSAGVATPTANITIAATHGWIQDPLVANSGVPLYGDIGPAGEPGLDDSSVKNVEYVASVTMLQILGNPDPMALIGQRMAGSNLTFNITTDSALQAANFRSLIKQAAPVLIRTLPEWGAALPGLCYLAVPKEIEAPQNEAWGGTVIHWALAGDLVSAPTSNVLVALFTYGNVAPLWSTYQQAQTTLSGLGRTYLDVLKSPSGA